MMNLKHKAIWLFPAVLLAILLISCDMNPTPPPTGDINGKFSPPAGKTLLIVGQDNDTIVDYLAADLPVPAGFTSYTSIERLEGLETAADYGAGTIHLTELANSHQNTVLAIGLYLVDYLDEFNSGEVDHQINQFIDHIAGYDRPVFVRFGYEFDGPWNRYDPDEYKAAWIKFHRMIEAKEANNIALVWQSATFCNGTYLGRPIEDWYPGDDVVDWVAASFFTQTSCGLQPINELIDFGRAHNKPVMLAEAAPQGYDIGNLTHSSTGGAFNDVTAEKIWRAWYEPLFETVEQNSDVVQAVAYINTHWDKQEMWGPPYRNGYWGDSRVQANPLIFERWSAETDQSHWLKASPTLFSELGFNQS